jgi:hypothetical protein
MFVRSSKENGTQTTRTNRLHACNRRRNNLFFTKYYLGNNIRKDEMGETCSTNGYLRNAFRILVGQPKGNSLLGSSWCRWENSIKICLKRNGVWEFLRGLSCLEERHGVDCCGQCSGCWVSNKAGNPLPFEMALQERLVSRLPTVGFRNLKFPSPDFRHWKFWSVKVQTLDRGTNENSHLVKCEAVFSNRNLPTFYSSGTPTNLCQITLHQD